MVKNGILCAVAIVGSYDDHNIFELFARSSIVNSKFILAAMSARTYHIPPFHIFWSASIFLPLVAPAYNTFQP